MTPIDPETAPEAPEPRPPLVIFMRVIENRAADDYDGGILLLQAVRGNTPELLAEVLDARLVVNAKTDGFLCTFPWRTRAAKQRRHFRLTLEEVPIEEVPPDPDAEPTGPQYDSLGRLLDPSGALSIPVQFKPELAGKPSVQPLPEAK